MKVENLYSSPVLIEDWNFSEEENQKLIAAAKRAEAQASPTGSYYDRSILDYSLLKTDAPLVAHFQDVMNRRTREYIYRSFQCPDAFTMHMQAAVFANVYTYGQRVRAHYHPDCHFVACYYPKIDPIEEPQFRTAEQGVFVLMDPRGTVQWPGAQSKIHRIPVKTGTFILHPSYMWHESEVYFGQGERICLVAEFKVITHSEKRYIDLPTCEAPEGLASYKAPIRSNYHFMKDEPK